MARNISLAVGRHAPFHFPKVGNGRTTLSIYRSSVTLRDVVAAVKDMVSLIAASGRIGAAVDARQTPDAKDLKTAGLEGQSFRF